MRARSRKMTHRKLIHARDALKYTRAQESGAERNFGAQFYRGRATRPYIRLRARRIIQGEGERQSENEIAGERSLPKNL